MCILDSNIGCLTILNQFFAMAVIPVHKGKIGIYSGVRVIASRILHEICLLIGELAIRGTKITLNARLGTENNLLIEQLLLGEHYCSMLTNILKYRDNNSHLAY